MGEAPPQAEAPARTAQPHPRSEALRLESMTRGVGGAWAPQWVVPGLLVMAAVSGFLIARALPAPTQETTPPATLAEAERPGVSLPEATAIVPDAKISAETGRSTDAGSGRSANGSAADQQPLREWLENWRQAWSDRDIEAYLGLYSPAFVPATGKTRAEWAATRRRNIIGRADLSVRVSGLEVRRLNEQRVELTFLQDYASGQYREVGRPKRLLLAREAGQWQIIAEEQRTQAVTRVASPETR